MPNSWFVVMSVKEAGDAEVGGPLVGGEVIDFEESGLALHWKEGEDDDEPELVVVDRYGEETSTGDPTAWSVHSHFNWRQTVVEDSGGESWIIIVADTLDAAEAVQGDQHAMSELWLDRPPEYRAEDDYSNDGLAGVDEWGGDDD